MLQIPRHPEHPKQIKPDGLFGGRRSLTAGPLAVLSALLIVLYAPEPLHAQSNSDAIYTAAQATAGRAAYAQACASCHGPNTDDGEFAPPLKGTGFTQKYAGKPVNDLINYMTGRMPPGNPGSLGTPAYTQIAAFLFQQNGVPPGNAELPVAAPELTRLMFPSSSAPGGRGGRGPGAGPGGGLTPGVQLPPPPKKANPLDKITAVSDAMLQNPPAADWLTWRRSSDYQGFSPLKQITKSNVNNLRAAWTLTLPPGANEATPLVHDGVMLLHGFGDKLQALDAASGDLLWQYSRQLPASAAPSVKRSIAIYGNKVYLGTSDVHLVALDVKTGQVAWDKELATDKGFRLTGGPLVAKGKVMVGTEGRVAGGNYIIALDAETGKEAWRFKTIAQPGEPGGDTWNGHPLADRNGASVWVAGSYDAQLNLTFWGVAQTYDTGVLAHPKPGVNNDGLYTDCTLALNPDTGKLVWYYQHLPNDQWDLDWVFERQIVRMPVNGTVRPVIMTAGKMAIYDVIDAETGKWIYSKDLGLQNIVTSIDPVTGKKNIDPNSLPGDDKDRVICPHAGGAKSWLPGSYNPNTRILYVPLVESCMDLNPARDGGRGSLSTGVRWTLRPRPGSDGNYGRVQAINMLTREVVWTSRHRAPESSGALDTAGGVVFTGSIDRYFRAYDDQTGKVLWETRLNDVPSNAPISYSANGKQYIAIGVGNGGPQATTFPPLVPEIQNTERAAAIWVFREP
jgi:alcohol dehydrogenase (cytochrome c)